MKLPLEHYLAARRRQFMPKADLLLSPAAIEQLRVASCDQSLADAHCRAALATIWPEQQFEQIADHQLGTFHQVSFYQTADLSSLAVRIGRLPDLLSDWALWSEATIRPHTARLSLATPEPFATDCSRSRFDFDFQIISRAEGVALSELDHDDTLLSPRLPQLAGYLARLHTIAGEGFGLLKFANDPQGELQGLHEHWSDYLLLNIDAHTRQCLQAGCIDIDEARAIEALFDRESIEQLRVESRLLHGDPGNPNCFIAGRKITLIDWEDALLGDHIFELAMWASFHPERRWSTFFAAYFASAPVGLRTDDWEERFWLYFLRIALFKTAHRLLFKRTDHPDRPPPSLRIQRALQALRATRFANRSGRACASC